MWFLQRVLKTFALAALPRPPNPYTAIRAAPIHVNDSFFWVVTTSTGVPVPEALRILTVGPAATCNDLLVRSDGVAVHVLHNFVYI